MLKYFFNRGLFHEEVLHVFQVERLGVQHDKDYITLSLKAIHK